MTREMRRWFGPAAVITHRRGAYQRLGIGSAACLVGEMLVRIRLDGGSRLTDGIELPCALGDRKQSGKLRYIDLETLRREELRHETAIDEARGIAIGEPAAVTGHERLERGKAVLNPPRDPARDLGFVGV